MQIKGLLVGWARDACLSSLANLQERLRLIQDRPLDLAGFVSYQVPLDHHVEAVDYLFEQALLPMPPVPDC